MNVYHVAPNSHPSFPWAIEQEINKNEWEQKRFAATFVCRSCLVHYTRNSKNGFYYARIVHRSHTKEAALKFAKVQCGIVVVHTETGSIKEKLNLPIQHSPYGWFIARKTPAISLSADDLRQRMAILGTIGEYLHSDGVWRTGTKWQGKWTGYYKTKKRAEAVFKKYGSI